MRLTLLQLVTTMGKGTVGITALAELHELCTQGEPVVICVSLTFVGCCWGGGVVWQSVLLHGQGHNRIGRALLPGVLRPAHHSPPLLTGHATRAQVPL